MPGYVLAVTLPSTALYAPNMTFLFDSGDLGRYQQSTSKCPNKTCFIVPRVTVYEGGMALATDAQTTLGFSLAKNNARIPVRLLAIPQWPVAGVPFDASALGLPVAPEYAAPAVPDDSDPATGFRIPLAPLTYRYVVSPVSELAYSVPPYFGQLTVEPKSDTEERTETLTVGVSGIPLDPLQTPDPSLSTQLRDFRGFTAYIASPARERITPIVRLSGTNPTVRFPSLQRLNAATNQFVPTNLTKGDYNLVIAPPEGSIAIPSLITPIPFSGTVLDPRYPPLPPPVPIKGTIVTSNGTAVQARLFFRSTAIVHGLDFGQNFMHYETPLTTDAEGRFITVLPPGSYTVWVEPLGNCDADDPSGCFGKTRQTITFDSSRDLTFTVTERTRVQGTAVTFDKRSLGDAEVIFAATRPPIDTSVDPLPPIAEPRAFHTHANRSGTFVGYLDPGTYDVIVRPTDGSHFPRAFSRIVVKPGASAPTLAPIVVPAPVRISFNIRDAGDNPLERAYVRAYVFDTGVFREVAAAATDDAADTAGNVTLLLPPSAPSL